MKKYYAARVMWIKEQDGGRKIPPEGTRYCPIIGLSSENNYWSIVFDCPDFSKTDRIIFSFLSDDAPEEAIEKAKCYELFEGNRRVAFIVVDEVGCPNILK